MVSREAGSGTRSSFEKILGGVELYGKAIIQDSNGTIRETVASIGNSIGYLSHGLLSKKTKALDVDGVHPGLDEINAGTYTLVRPVFLLTKGPQRPSVTAFLDYILSPVGQKTIADNGLLAVR